MCMMGVFLNSSRGTNKATREPKNLAENKKIEDEKIIELKFWFLPRRPCFNIL